MNADDTLRKAEMPDDCFCAGFRPPAVTTLGTLGTLGRPASEKRQGTKSREVGMPNQIQGGDGSARRATWYPPATIAQRKLPVIGLLDDGLPAEFLTGDRVLKSRFSKY